LASSDSDSKVSIIDTATDLVESWVEVGKAPHGLVISPDGSVVLVAVFGTNQVVKLSAKDGSFIDAAPVANPQGTTAWVTNEASNDLSVVDLATGKVTATIPVGNAPRKLVVQPQGGGSTATPAGPGASANATPLVMESPALTTASSVTPASGSAPAGSSAATVAIKSMAFGTPIVTVKVGQTVTWTNLDSINHTVTADLGQFDSGPVAPEASFSMKFTQAGTFGYHCSIHPFMQGIVKVEKKMIRSFRPERGPKTAK
jgi:amicyanin